MVGDEIKFCIQTEEETGEWHDVPEGQTIDPKELCKCKPHSNCGCKRHLSKIQMEKESKRIQSVIDKLTDDAEMVAHESLRRYFVRLSQYGYYDYKATYRILALMMITNFRDEFSQFWNKEDERVIERVLNCLYCSICAIPRPDRIVDTEITEKGATRKDYVPMYDNEEFVDLDNTDSWKYDEYENLNPRPEPEPEPEIDEGD